MCVYVWEKEAKYKIGMCLGVPIVKYMISHNQTYVELLTIRTVSKSRN